MRVIELLQLPFRRDQGERFSVPHRNPSPSNRDSNHLIPGDDADRVTAHPQINQQIENNSFQSSLHIPSRAGKLHPRRGRGNKN